MPKTHIATPLYTSRIRTLLVELGHWLVELLLLLLLSSLSVGHWRVCTELGHLLVELGHSLVDLGHLLVELGISLELGYSLVELGHSLEIH